jgi:polyisoprenoid-binding protein YceI
MLARIVFALPIALLIGVMGGGPAGAEMERWVVDTTRSRAGFDAYHPLGNFTGTSEAVTGEVQLDIADLKKPVQGALSVPVSTLRTGKSGRDKDLRRALDGDRHPEVRFQIDRMDSSFTSVAENSDVLVTIHGVLTMRGGDGPVGFTGRIRLRGGTLWARGESRVVPQDWGVPLLRSWLVSMEDHVLATFDLVLRRSQ